MTRELRRVAVLGGVRIPFCRSNTLYADLSNLDMMTAALNGLVDRFGLKGQHIDEVVGGAVVTHSKDFNLAREAVLGSKLAPSTPKLIGISVGHSVHPFTMAAWKMAVVPGVPPTVTERLPGLPAPTRSANTLIFG